MSKSHSAYGADVSRVLAKAADLIAVIGTDVREAITAVCYDEIAPIATRTCEQCRQGETLRERVRVNLLLRGFDWNAPGETSRAYLVNLMRSAAAEDSRAVLSKVTP
jgi:hypothetical protein